MRAAEPLARRAQCTKAQDCLLRSLCAQASHDHAQPVVSTPSRNCKTGLEGVFKMQGMLNKIVVWLRAGYPKDAPQFGHAALVALCPASRG